MTFKVMIELYQFPKLSKYLRRGISDQMVMEMLNKEISSNDIRPLMLHFVERDGANLISSWFARVKESNNGLLFIPCFTEKEGLTSSKEAAEFIFSSFKEIDGRSLDDSLLFSNALPSYFRRIADWIGSRGVWLLLIDKVENLLDSSISVHEAGFPVLQTSNVRTIYTTADGAVAHKFRESGVRVVEIAGLSGHPESEVVDHVLRSAGLRLPEEIVSLIARKAGTDDPAFIRQLAGKLRVYGISDESLSIISGIDLSAKV